MRYLLKKSLNWKSLFGDQNCLNYLIVHNCGHDWKVDLGHLNVWQIGYILFIHLFSLFVWLGSFRLEKYLLACNMFGFRGSDGRSVSRNTFVKYSCHYRLVEWSKKTPGKSSISVHYHCFFWWRWVESSYSQLISLSKTLILSSTLGSINLATCVI